MFVNFVRVCRFVRVCKCLAFCAFEGLWGLGFLCDFGLCDFLAWLA